MGNFDELKQAIADVIKTNGRNEITGAILQNVLQSIVTSVGSGSTFKGIATPQTSVGVPDQNIFYIAQEQGSYRNFGIGSGVYLGDNEIIIFYTQNNAWSYVRLDVAKATRLNALSAEVSAHLPMAENDGFRYNLLDVNSSDYKEGFSLNNLGELVVNANYATSNFIPFTQAMGTLTSSVNGVLNASGGGAIMLYDAQKRRIAYGTLTQWGGKAIWQSGVFYARFSLAFYQNGHLQIEVGNNVTNYLPFGTYVPKETPNLSQLNSTMGGPAYHANVADIAPSFATPVRLEGFPKNLKKGTTLTLSANIVNKGIWAIYFGFGLKQYRGRCLVFSNAANKIETYNESGAVSSTETITPHNALKDKIKVLIKENNGRWEIVFGDQDKTYYYTTTNETFESNGDIYLRCDNCGLTNIHISATNNDFKKPLWAFGDSYFGVTNDRWIGQAREGGYFDFLINGLAGQKSVDAYAELTKCLQYGTPKYLLWSLGMNDTDEQYTTHLDAVIQLCQEKNISLIIGMPPSVPTRNKTNIQQHIINSGARFIDFRSAVNADTTQGTWYNGLLSTDGVHPTESGAKVLFVQTIADFSEISQYCKGAYNIDNISKRIADTITQITFLEAFSNAEGDYSVTDVANMLVGGLETARKLRESIETNGNALFFYSSFGIVCQSYKTYYNNNYNKTWLNVFFSDDDHVNFNKKIAIINENTFRISNNYS